MFHLFNSRSIRQSAFVTNPFSNRAVIVVCVLLVFLQTSVTYIPFMNSAFGTVPLPLKFWFISIIMGIFVFFVVEGEKYVMRQLDKRKAAAQGLSV
ncbi:MAG: cation transporting ATPase C-terminal domain-containing protein, partial [Candidatus Adiutrix sp.]